MIKWINWNRVQAISLVMSENHLTHLSQSARGLEGWLGCFCIHTATESGDEEDVPYKVRGVTCRLVDCTLSVSDHLSRVRGAVLGPSRTQETHVLDGQTGLRNPSVPNVSALGDMQTWDHHPKFAECSLPTNPGLGLPASTPSCIWLSSLFPLFCAFLTPWNHGLTSITHLKKAIPRQGHYPLWSSTCQASVNR